MKTPQRRRPRVSQEFTDAVLKDYDSGLSRAEIHRKHHLKYDKLDRIITWNGRERNYTFRNFEKCADYDEFKTQILDEYENGVGFVKLAEKYHIGTQTLKNRLIEEGVFRPFQAKAIDETYFEKIDTFYKAYFFGFLLADGSVITSRPLKEGQKAYDYLSSVSCNLQARDGYILQKLVEEMKLDRPLSYREAYQKGWHPQVNFRFSNKHIAQCLFRLGMEPRKSFTLEFPSAIPDQFMSAFLLGFFDGDGTITYKTERLKKPPHRESVRGAHAAFFCSIPFGDRLVELLKQRYDIDATKWHKHSKNGCIYQVSIAKRDDLPKLYAALYTDAPFCLLRKREKFERIFEMRGASA